MPMLPSNLKKKIAQGQVLQAIPTKINRLTGLDFLKTCRLKEITYMQPSNL